jgi:hypothetical protein
MERTEDGTMTIPSVRDTHNAWVATLTDLTAGEDDVVDIDRNVNRTTEAHADQTIRGTYNDKRIANDQWRDGIEPPIYTAPDTTTPTINDNDPEGT